MIVRFLTELYEVQVNFSFTCALHIDIAVLMYTTILLVLNIVHSLAVEPVFVVLLNIKEKKFLRQCYLT